MTQQPTPHRVRSVTAFVASLTDVTLGSCALALIATESRVVHGLCALALVVLLATRLERAE